jgi:Secretion system C-terminal sorting domain
LNMTPDMDGAAFRRKSDSTTIYCLWAKTKLDRSEQTSAVYSFPDPLSIKHVQRMDWNFSITGDVQIIDSKLVALSGAPTFYRKGQAELRKMPVKDPIFCFPNPAKNELFINFKIEQEGAKTSLKLYDVASRKLIECFDNQQFTAGLHQWRVNTEGVSSGSYIVQLTVSGRLFTKKIFVGK